MQPCHMDHNYFGRGHLPSYCHICADLEDVSDEDRKDDRKMPLDRKSVSEYQTLHGGMKHTENPPLFESYAVLESL